MDSRDPARGVPHAPIARPATKPTLRTIAQMTGFNVTTISRALNNAPELSADTRDRVQKIAAEIGYVPDRTALRLKTGRTHVISLLLDAQDDLFGMGQSMVSGLTEALRGTPYHVVITPGFRNAPPLDPIHYIVRNRVADGIILSRTEPDDARIRFLLDEDFPFVSHGRTGLSRPHAFVDYDNEAFAHHAVLRLAEKGCRRVSILVPSQRYSFGLHLRAGFSAAMAETGVDGEIMQDVTIDSSAEQIRLATMERLSRPDSPDGFICTGDSAALGVMAGITDLGLTIGRDVEIVAKQTSGIFSQVRPRVDTIHEDTALAGKQMGELLLRRIQGEDPATLQIIQQPRIWF